MQNPDIPNRQDIANLTIMVKGLIEEALKDPENQVFVSECEVLQRFLVGQATINEAILAMQSIEKEQPASS